LDMLCTGNMGTKNPLTLRI